MAAIRTSLTRFGLAMLVALVVLGACPRGDAQDIMLPDPNYQPRVKKPKPKRDVLPAAPQQLPAFSIPVAPLGFGSPSATYLGRQYSLMSLDFLDEKRLLFSFRAPGLLARDASESSGDRQMKAVVLKLPEGTVESQTLWTLSDRLPYLWMLQDGHFLLRDHEGLKIGDASLQNKPVLNLSGEFQNLQINPEGTVAAVQSLERMSPTPNAALNVVTRVVQLRNGQVETSHSSSVSELPVNSDGFLAITHDNKYDLWSLKLTSFSNDTRLLGHIRSNCLPIAAFLSDQKILVSGCNPYHIPTLQAVSTSGHVLWETETPVAPIPPLLITTPSDSRFARESIIFKKVPSAGSEILWVKAVRGQVVRVFDSATGKAALEVPIKPIFDAGGNVAISPSGRRVAILNGGAIQVFELPTPPVN